MSTERERRDWWINAGDKDTWADICVPANATNLDGYTAAATVDTALADFPGTLLFDNGADSMTGGVITLPRDWFEGSLIYPSVHWSKTTDAAGAVVWSFKYRKIGNAGGAVGAWASADLGTLTNAPGDLAATLARTTFSGINLPLTTDTAGTKFAWLLVRDVGDDTYAAPVRMYSIDFSYKKMAGKRGTIEAEL